MTEDNSIKATYELQPETGDSLISLRNARTFLEVLGLPDLVEFKFHYEAPDPRHRQRVRATWRNKKGGHTSWVFGGFGWGSWSSSTASAALEKFLEWIGYDGRTRIREWDTYHPGQFDARSIVEEQDESLEVMKPVFTLERPLDYAGRGGKPILDV